MSTVPSSHPGEEILSPLHAGAESPHPVRFAMSYTPSRCSSPVDSDAAGPSFDTEDTSVWDALGEEAEGFNMVTARPHHPDETVWCEFVELLDCHATFALDNQGGWIKHHADHLQHVFPEKLWCWFCNDFCFVAASPMDRYSSFTHRMEHIWHHIFEDPGWTIAQMQPDFHMVHHLHQRGLLDDELYKHAMLYIKVPLPAECPMPEPLPYLSSLSRPLGHKAASPRERGESPLLHLVQIPDRSIDANTALDGLQQFRPVPEGGPDCPVGGLETPPALPSGSPPLPLSPTPSPTAPASVSHAGRPPLVVDTTIDPPSRGTISGPSDGQSHWDAYRDVFMDLYLNHGKELPEVMRTMESVYGFVATRRMYKRQFKAWGLTRSLTTEESIAMMSIAKKPREIDNKETIFTRRGKRVEPGKLRRFEERHGASGSFYNAQVETPPNITYGTPEPEPNHSLPLALPLPSDQEMRNGSPLTHHMPWSGAMPFTDSGYASVLPGRFGSVEIEDKDEDDSDTKTEISAASTAIGPEAHRPISEVCSDIYNQVQRHLDEDNKTLVLGALPNLIKAFAIRLAHLEPSDTSRRVMHFVYSRHQDILSQLRQLFETESEPKAVSCWGRQGGMSVLEKMRLWSSKPQDEDYPRTPEDAFQGVKDIDDGMSHPEASTYGQAILQSKEYGWLIQQLLRESSFHWGPGARIMVDEIRHTIMNGLPRTGRVSKIRDPCVHRAEFRIPWPQLRQRLLQECKRTGAGWSGVTVSSTVVLVSSADDCILATSVGEYIDRTWGDDRELLAKFGATLEGELGSTHSHNSDIIDHTDATTPSIPLTLSVFVEGVSHSIAEQGEQLAWLVSALQNSKTREILYNKPSIVKRDTGIWEIQVDLTPGPVVNTGGLSTLKKLGWLGEAIEPVIVQGYPTFRRPSSPFAASLELSPVALFFRGHTHLLIRASPLELAKQRQGVCLWHMGIMNEGKEWSCQCNPEPAPGLPGGLGLCRHFVDICPGSVNFNKRLDATLLLADEAHLRARDSSPALAAAGSPPSSPSSTETSLDSDMMSIPDSSEAPLHDIPDHLSSVIGRVADRLLHEYRTGTWGMASAPAAVSPHEGAQHPPLDTVVDLGTVLAHSRPARGQHAGRAASCHTSDGRGNKDSVTSSRPNLKRAGGDKDESQDGDDGQGSMPPPKKRCHGNGLPTLACPYYKLNPVRYRDCAKLDKLWEVKHVKQHLLRRHRYIHCARCATVFLNEAAHRRHLEEVACLFKPWDLRDHLITPEQQKELGKRSKGGSLCEQWFAIWDIVFPGCPKPPSPYLETGISPEFCEYAMGRGPVIILEELRAAGFHEPNTSILGAQGSCALEVVRRALSAMVGEFVSSQLSLACPSGPSGTPASEVSSRESISSVFADSGVSVRDRHAVPPPSQEDASLAGQATLGSRAVFDQSQADLPEGGFGFDNSESQLLVRLPPGANEIETQNQANPLGGHIDTNERIVSNPPGPYIPTQGPPPVTEEFFGQSGIISHDLTVTGNDIPDQNPPLWLEDYGNNNQAGIPGFGDTHVSGGNPNAAVEVSYGSGDVFDWESTSHSFLEWNSP